MSIPRESLFQHPARESKQHAEPLDTAVRISVMALAAKFGSRSWPGGDPSETRAGLLPKRLNDLDVVADGGAA
jgi:hypothetical protein